MAGKRGGLGRGLGALLPQSQNQIDAKKDTVNEIFTALIKPNRYQPRREFDEAALNELAESIKAYGILQPIIVRSLDDGSYELIAGERRLRASKMVGLEKIPAIIREYTDAQMSEISIIENVQRENLNVIEEAQAYDRLIKEFGHTQEVVAAKIGRSRSHISNILRLLKLSPKVRELISNGKLTLGQARPLLAIENPIIQLQAAEMILSEGLSVRKVEAFINELKNSGLLANLTADMEKVAKSSSNEVAAPPTENKIEEPKNFIKNNIDNKPTIDKIIIKENSTSNKINPDLGNENKVAKPVKQKSADDIRSNLNDIYIRDMENRLTEILGTQVKISMSKKRGRIQIDFNTEEDLMRILERFDDKEFKPPVTPTVQKPESTREEKIAALRRFSTSQNFKI